MTGASRPRAAAGDDRSAKHQARDSDPEIRKAVASRTDISPELLFFLAADTVEAVRREIAANPATPGQADVLLAGDPADGVRTTVLEKAVGRIPANGTEPDGPLEKFTLQVLKILARDPSPAIRQVLSEAVGSLEHVPHEVVSSLARDEEAGVAEPVLRHSPQLTDEDLVAVLDIAPTRGRMAAIAKRPDLSHRVADAIVRTDDIDAVALLLGNDSAQIREETLDHILAKAPGRKSWHRPLVYRPNLSGAAVRRLARFVAVSLVEVLQQRNEMDDETATAVVETLRERLKKDGAALDDGPDAPAAGADPPTEAGGDRARRLFADGALTEEQVDDAIFQGDRAFVLGALALLAGVEEGIVESILNAQSARGVVAIVWKAGLGMRLAMKVQMQIAKIAPAATIKARDGVEYPLSEDELTWQLEFFGAA